MNNEHSKSILHFCSLFSDLGEENTEKLLKSASFAAYHAGCDITAFTQGRLTVIASGSANVYSNDAESNTLLRVLSVGDVFGVAGLLSGYTDISRIIVKSGKLSVISIPKEEILSLISDDPGFARKYVSLLEQKIVFLNRRILAFTAGTCERRLATFLNSVSSEEQFEVGPIAFSSLAMQLNMGRASFYRALDAFEKDGLIRRETKTLYVLSRSKLKEKYLK
jgi:CRP-like cAMP-binding protein